MRSTRLIYRSATLGALVFLGTLLLAPAAEAYESLSQARRALGHKQAAERARAAIWIGNQGEAVSRGLAAQLLERTLSDPHPSVRRAGWNAMARLRIRSLWPELRRRLPIEQSPEVMPAAIIEARKRPAQGLWSEPDRHRLAQSGPGKPRSANLRETVRLPRVKQSHYVCQ